MRVVIYTSAAPVIPAGEFFARRQARGYSAKMRLNSPGLGGSVGDMEGQGYRQGMSAGLTTDGILVSPIR